MRTYFPELDIVKGMAILLVILGHSFCSFPFDINQELPAWAAPLADSFSMALFFMASGFLFSTRDAWGTFLSKKVRRLLVPYACFYLATVSLRLIFSGITHSGGGGQTLLTVVTGLLVGRHYWFLYTLFIYMVVLRLVASRWVRIALAAVSVAAVLLTDVETVGVCQVGRTVRFFPFFLLGVMWRPVYGRLRLGGARAAGLMALSAALFAPCFVWREASQALDIYATSLFGSLTVWGLAALIARWRCPVLSHFGRASLQYYLNHLLIMLPVYYAAAHIPAPALVRLVFIWAGATAVSYVMCLVERSNAPMRWATGMVKRNL